MKLQTAAELGIINKERFISKRITVTKIVLLNTIGNQRKTSFSEMWHIWIQQEFRSKQAMAGTDASVSAEKNMSLSAVPMAGMVVTGGNVLFVATLGMSTLIDLRHNPRQVAENGGHGIGKRRDGADGADCVVKVPAGTIIRNLDTAEVLADLTEPDETVVVARGGIGGKGNACFKSSTFQAPRVAEKGEPGEEREISLEVKLIADIGLVGYPNAGKSTLLARSSAATPKIAAYPFTTLRPNLGVVRINREQNFVLADIPGLIEGAHKGAGLGHRFLRHIERTKMLIHVIDLSATDGRDPIQDYEQLNLELGHYNELLTKLPQIIALNKIDMSDAEANLERVQKYFGKRKVFPISAVTGEGVNPLMQQAYRSLQYLETRARKEAETSDCL